MKRPSPSASRPVPAATAVPAPGPRYVVAVEAGPAQGQRFRLPASGAVVGRSRGAILFPDDPFISPHHATLVVKEGKLFVRDESSTSGVFVGIQAQVTIPVEGEFAVGLRRFRFDGPLDPTPAQGRVAMYGAPLPASQLHYRIEELLVGGRPGRAIVSSSSIITVGQGRCDLSFPGDEALAPRHCELSPLPTGLMIRDLSGGLGTFVRITPGVERPLKLGDRLRIGQQVLAVEAG